MSFPEGPRPLPGEILAIIFCYLARKELYHCLFVSQLWHSVSESRLYSNVTLDPLFQRHGSLIPALKARKSLVRRVEWREINQRTPVADLYSILLGYRPDDIITINNNGGHGHPTLRQLIPPPPPLPRNGKMATSDHGIKAYGLDHRHAPALTQFSYIGDLHSLKVLESVIFHATTLTVLELSMYYTSLGTIGPYIVDVERILATLPLLRELSVQGPKHVYPALAAPSKDDGGDYLASLELMTGITALTTTSTTGAPRYRLELFTFERQLVQRQGPGAFLFFSRLGNLTKIVVRSLLVYFDDFQDGRPWAIGRALRDYCPKIESIESEGVVPFWLFDLPFLPYSKIPYIASLVEGASLFQAKIWLAVQERKELLEGRTAAEPFFPQLKTLLFGPGHTFSAQDLVSLGVQAQFLTHVEIFAPFYEPRVWAMYDKEAFAATATATASASVSMAHFSSSEKDRLVEDRRLRKRGPISGRDVVLFLQHCSSLRHFRLSGAYSVYFDDLIDTVVTTTTALSYNSITRVTETTRFIRPWACELALETLKIQLSATVERPEEHALLWKHLGRLKKLRSLTLITVNNSLTNSSLISSPDLVVEGLVEGGMKETLEEIRLAAWWEVEDRREMVLWFARAFPRLRVLGLEYRKEFVEGERGRMYTAFLQDGAVKRCSIPKVFVETARNSSANFS